MTDEGYNWFDYLPGDAQEQLVAEARELDRLRAENAALRQIAAETYRDILARDRGDGCHCYVCDRLRETISEDEAEAILYPAKHETFKE